jgi:hypothetical protein
MTDLLFNLDHLLDDPFHGAAVAAYVELARRVGGPPDPQATRDLAYRYYEEHLARKNAARSHRPKE